MNSPPGLEEVRPEAIEQHLEANGWIRARSMRSGSVQWTRADSRVVVPRDRDFDDYAWMIDRLISVLAEIENTPRDVLLLEFANPQADLLRVVIEVAGTRDRAPLVAVWGALGAVRGMIEAAAWNIGVQVGLSSIRATALAGRYGEAVDVAATRLGSYVLPVVIPLDAPMPYPVEDSTDSQEPIGRRITTSLARSFQQLSELATGERDTLRQDWILDRPSLLALRKAVGDTPGRQVGFGFKWSPLVDVEPPDVDVVAFDASSAAALVSYLPELSDEFADFGEAAHGARAYAKREDLEYPLTFIGTVETLRWSRPTLRGDLHGRSRAVGAYLDDEQYRLAIRAHELQLDVRVIGIVRERGRGTPTFVEVQSFELMD